MTFQPLFDMHAHLYHPRWYPAKVNEHLLAAFQLRKSSGHTAGNHVQFAPIIWRMLSDPTGERSIRVMNKVGISRRVILIVDWGIELGEPEASIGEIHREILTACKKSQGRLIGFAGFDPRRLNAPELLWQACEDYGAAGLKLHPTGSWKLDDPATQELVDVAVNRGIPVMVHVGRTMPILSDAYAQPQALVRLAASFPRGLFIAGHSGFELFPDFIRMETPDNVFFDISGWQDWLASEPVLRHHLYGLLQAFPGRVCFGTDSPFFTYNLESQENRWAALVRDCIKEAPLELKGAAIQLCQGPPALEVALGSCCVA